MKPFIPTFDIPKPDDRYYCTSSEFVAAYLSLMRLPLVNVEASSNLVVFIFRDAPDRETWVEAFNKGRTTVNARQFVLAIRDMRRLSEWAKRERKNPIY